MPLFRKSTVKENEAPAAAPAPAPAPSTKRASSGSFFSRSSRSTGGIDMSTNTSLADAHAKLDAATASERAAENALRAARIAVRDARDMLVRLEREAHREVDAAAAKLKEARSLRKDANGLGKFGSA